MTTTEAEDLASRPVIGYIVNGAQGVHPSSVHIRLLQRMRDPRARSARFVEMVSRDFVYGRDTTEYSAIIVQRASMDPDLVEGFLVTARERGVPFFVDLDDDLVSASAMPRLIKGGYDERVLRALRRLIENARAVMVSTPTLAAILDGIARAVVVIPNDLDDAIWAPARVPSPSESGEVRVLYAGSPTHAEDLAILEPVFDSLVSSDGRAIVLEIIGVTFASETPFRRLGIPAGADHYPGFARTLMAQSDRWQVGVAPLVDTDFNAAKSDLKFLEYTAMGLPTVASAVGPYRDLGPVGAILVPNSVAQWREAIIRSVDEPAATVRAMLTAQDYLRQHRMLSSAEGMTTWLRELGIQPAPPGGESEGANRLSEPETGYRFIEPSLPAPAPALVPAAKTLRGSAPVRFAERAARSLVRRARALQRPRPAPLAPEVLHSRSGDLVVDFGLHTSPDVPSLISRLRSAPDVIVVIPVYNGGDAVRDCLESVIEHTPGHRIIVLDDHSTDPEVIALLDELEARGDIEVVRNAENLGYTRTANRAMTLDETADVVMLNSDTLVGPQWLERLRWTGYSLPRVAGVSAFSNSAGSHSLPITSDPSVWPEPAGWASVARYVMQNADSWALEGPTIHGFCCYYRREAIAAVGLFDEEMFPRGYGEENEWSMRALAAGFLNLGAPHVFVKHLQGVSFGTARDELIRTARAKIDQLHPSFGRLVNQWWGGAGFARLRLNSFASRAAVETAIPVPRVLEVSVEPSTVEELAETVIAGRFERVVVARSIGRIPEIVAETCDLLGVPVQLQR